MGGRQSPRLDWRPAANLLNACMDLASRGAFDLGARPRDDAHPATAREKICCCEPAGLCAFIPIHGEVGECLSPASPTSLSNTNRVWLVDMLAFPPLSFRVFAVLRFSTVQRAERVTRTLHPIWTAKARLRRNDWQEQSDVTNLWCLVNGRGSRTTTAGKAGSLSESEARESGDAHVASNSCALWPLLRALIGTSAFLRVSKDA
jgi:hypothetical protein